MWPQMPSLSRDMNCVFDETPVSKVTIVIVVCYSGLKKSSLENDNFRFFGGGLWLFCSSEACLEVLQTAYFHDVSWKMAKIQDVMLIWLRSGRLANCSSLKPLFLLCIQIIQ